MAPISRNPLRHLRFALLFSAVAGPCVLVLVCVALALDSQRLLWAVFVYETLFLGLVIYVVWEEQATSERRTAMLTNALLQKVGDTPGEFAEILKSVVSRLSELELREELLLDFSPDGVIAVDESLRVIDVNQSFKNIAGLSHKEMKGGTLQMLLGDARAGSLAGALREARKSLSPVKVEIEFGGAGSETRFTEWTLEWSEQLQQVFCIVEDRTQERTIARLKQEFSSMLTHDMRSPLSALQVTLQSLSAGDLGGLTPKGHQLVGDSLVSLAHLNRLINHMIMLNRSDEGQLAVSCKRVQVDGLLEEAASTVSSLADASGIALAVNPVDELVWCDEGAVLQILNNLLSNAVKFSSRGQTVRLSAVAYLGEVEFLVEDEGPGIPDAEKSQIFERYKQVAPHREQEKAGTGLGLSVCKALVQAHGGWIGVRDRQGGGSCFFFRLRKPAED